MPAASLWAAVPHYVAVAPNPKGALAILRRLESLVGVTVDASDLETAAVDYERQVTRAVELDPEVQAFVERLERAADEEEGPTDLSQLPSGDVLAREFQRFLRQRGGGPAGRLTEYERARARRPRSCMRVLFATTRGAGHFGPLAPFAQRLRRAPATTCWSPARRPSRRSSARAGLPFRRRRGGAGRRRRRRLRAGLVADRVGRARGPRPVRRPARPHGAARHAGGGRRVAARRDRPRDDGVRLGRRRRPPRRAAGPGRHPPRRRRSTAAARLEDARGARPRRSALERTDPEAPLLTRSPGAPSEPRRRTASAADAAPASPAAARSSTSPSAPRRRPPSTSRACTGAPSTRSPSCRCACSMTIGDRRDPAELGPLPPSVRVERWVSQADGDAAGRGDGRPRRLGLDADARWPPASRRPSSRCSSTGRPTPQRVAELGAGIVADATAAGRRARAARRPALPRRGRRDRRRDRRAAADRRRGGR